MTVSAILSEFFEAIKKIQLCLEIKKKVQSQNERTCELKKKNKSLTYCDKKDHTISYEKNCMHNFKEHKKLF